MTQVALFIDAGYLLAEAGGICCRTKRRAEIVCDYRGLVETLGKFTIEGSKLPLLRMYWYDAARGGLPAKDHLAVAELPNVKLRLGRLVERGLGRFEQKGVDSLIIRDLMTLARERAITTAYLLGGDEDLREGIAAIQDMGIRVILVGVAAEEQNQAETLVQEADEHVELDREFLAPYFTVAPSREERAEGVNGSESDQAREIGIEFARTCAANIGYDQLRAILDAYPRIPSDLDGQLLREATAALGSVRDRFDLKVELRAAFWDAMNEAVVRAGEETTEA